MQRTRLDRAHDGRRLRLKGDFAEADSAVAAATSVGDIYNMYITVTEMWSAIAVLFFAFA